MNEDALKLKVLDYSIDIAMRLYQAPKPEQVVDVFNTIYNAVKRG